MKKSKKVGFFVVLLFLTCSLNSFLAQERNTSIMAVKLTDKYVFDTLPLNLEEITDSANRIFSGTCINREEIQNDSVSNLNVVKYTFSIEESIKGVDNLNQISFKQWKPTTKNAGFEVNKKYVVFLYPESELGLTSPVGFQQGKFSIEKKGLNRGVEYIKNSINNIGLYRNIRTQRKISINDKYLDSYISQCSESGQPIKYKEFVKTVRHLIKE